MVIGHGFCSWAFCFFLYYIISPAARAMASNGVEGGAIDIGSKVVLEGLVARADLNGRSGVVISFDAERGRFGVEVDGQSDLLALKPANLQPLVEAQRVDLSILWRAIPENAPTAEIARAVQGLRAVADAKGFVLVDIPVVDGTSPSRTGHGTIPPGAGAMGNVLVWCNVKRAKEVSSSHHFAVVLTPTEDGLINTVVVGLQPEGSAQQEAVPRGSTKEQSSMSTFALLHGLAYGLERGELPTLPKVARGAIDELAKLPHRALPAARALLQLSIPVVEAAAGGPTRGSVGLRYFLGEFCEELCDYDGAIKAYKGIASECRDLLRPAHLNNPRPGLEDAPASEMVFAALGLAYKRAGKYDLAEETYRDGLRGVRTGDLSKGPQVLRWNLYKLLLESGEAALVQEKTNHAAFALFGGPDAALCQLKAAISR